MAERLKSHTLPVTTSDQANNRPVMPRSARSWRTFAPQPLRLRSTRRGAGQLGQARRKAIRCKNSKPRVVALRASARMFKVEHRTSALSQLIGGGGAQVHPRVRAPNLSAYEPSTRH